MIAISRFLLTTNVLLITVTTENAKMQVRMRIKLLKSIYIMLIPPEKKNSLEKSYPNTLFNPMEEVK